MHCLIPGVDVSDLDLSSFYTGHAFNNQCFASGVVPAGMGKDRAATGFAWASLIAG